MLLNREIGSGENMIDGARFQEELLMLDDMGKKRIKVYINCPGGNVIDGYNILNAILKSKTPVDTYNVGVAASMAGPIFAAGRKRYMADYARVMMHPVQGENVPADQYENMMDSLATALAAKTKVTKDVMRQRMNVTEWLDASQCLADGLCTEIESTQDENRKYMAMDAAALWSEADNQLKNLFTTNMKNVTNVLGLNEQANEASIVEAINVLKTESTRLTQALNTATEAATTAEARVQELQEQLAQAQNDLQAERDAATAAQAEAEQAQALAAAQNLIGEFSSRLGGNEEVRNMWIEDAAKDLEGTRKKLEALPLNAKAANVHTTNTPGSGAVPLTAAGIMAEISNKTQLK